MNSTHLVTTRRSPLTVAVLVLVAAAVPLVLAALAVPMYRAAPLSLAWLAGVALAAVDLREHRLPNRGTAALGAAGLATAGALQALGVIGGFGTAVAGGVLFLAMGIVEATPRDSIGGGDVKLMAALGVWSGWLGWPAIFSAFVLIHLAMIGVLVVARIRSTGPPALGPAIVIAAAASWMLAAAGMWT